ncbi:MAG TPA: rod shape-determining protein MreC [Chloroflexota bacterium]
MFGRVVALALVLLIALALVLAGQLPLAASLGGLALDVVAPLEELVSGTYSGAAGSGSKVQTIDELVEENQRLRLEVERLMRDGTRAPELQRENDQLRELLGLKRGGASFQWADAKVIGYDANNLVRSAVIDRGGRDGLVDGMTVMTPRGLVGKVVKLGPTAARVLLVTDPASSVNAMVQRSRARGVVYGQRGAAGGSQLVLRYVPQGEEMAAGDRVITSGLGGIFPEGIAIGQVTQVRQQGTDMFQEATVEPYVDFGRVESVFVITNHVPVKLD